MAAIDIGPGAIDRASDAGMTYTTVEKGNPSNGTGTIDTVEIWMYIAGSNVEVATFIHEGSNVLSTRDSEVLGSVASGSKQTFSGLNMSVVTGDYIGFYGTAGRIEYYGTGGADEWWKSGDYIPCTSQTFSVAVGDVASIYGTGITPPTGWAAGSLNGIAAANIASVCGVLIANISKINGV